MLSGERGSRMSWDAISSSFSGKQDGYIPKIDEVVLDVSDEYLALPDKTRAICKWSLEHGYDYTFMADDDVYLRPERLLDSGFQSHDYIGRLRGPSGQWPAPYCSGFSYWLSAKAAKAVIRSTWNGDTADDRYVGNALQEAGLKGSFDERYRVTRCDESQKPGEKGNHDREDCMVGNEIYSAGLTGAADYRYRVVNAFSRSIPNTATGGEGPREGNDIISACEFEPEQMERIHQQWLSSPGTPARKLSEGEFSNVCVLIKTFLRDQHLEECIRGLGHRLPEIKIVVVDDGEECQRKIKLYQRLREEGHVCIWLPKDSGFGAKANAGIAACDRPYVLIGSDDFNFNDSLEVRAGIRAMRTVLDNVPAVGVASGRVDRVPYEFTFDEGDGWIRQIPGYHGGGVAQGVPYRLCDLTVNYSLIRREVFDKVRWDDGPDAPKIGGGEHGAFYLDVKKAGWKVAYVPGANINQIKNLRASPDYLGKRSRAQSPERPCYTKRGIKHYITSSGCEMCGPDCRI
jgi:GT2 family glycosyltransferase